MGRFQLARLRLGLGQSCAGHIVARVKSEAALEAFRSRCVVLVCGCKFAFGIGSPGAKRRELLRSHRADVVRLLRIEAGYFATKMVPDSSVTAYHIYFPDPWPKRKHARHRLINLAFVGELDRTLGQGGVVHVATDDLDYFAVIKKVFAASGRFEEQSPEHLPVEAQTEFEKIFLAQGKPIGRARYVRSVVLPMGAHNTTGERQSTDAVTAIVP